MVKTIKFNVKENNDSVNTQTPAQTEEQEFLYEVELNKRIVNRRRRNALDTNAIADLKKFMEDMGNDS